MSDFSRVRAWFDTICSIPHPSGHEQALRDHILGWASDRGLRTRVDGAGNLVVYKPGQGRGVTSEPLALQSHLDMVAEKNMGTPHNFLTDPIRTRVEGEWLKAEGTTLGADDGVGVALMLALLEDSQVSHPPLECLFTVDEETGLTGALKLDNTLLSARRLINLDSEETGVITIGCAGGVTGMLTRTFAAEPHPQDWEVRRLWVKGLPGGHSGRDIHERIGNALVLLSRLWDDLCQSSDWRLQSLRGGDKHNAIPREAYLEAWTQPENWDRLEQQLAGWRATFAEELGERAAQLELKITPSNEERALGRAASRLMADVLLALPHGVWTMSPSIENLVESSSNFAAVGWSWVENQAQVKITFSCRSDRPSLLEALLNRYAAIGRLGGWKLETRDAYPGWTPNPQSRLLQKASAVWKDLTGQAPLIQSIHAGLECGVIAAKYPGMDMISIGPDIRGNHTPDEALHLPSFDLMWRYLRKLVETLC